MLTFLLTFDKIQLQAGQSPSLVPTASRIPQCVLMKQNGFFSLITSLLTLSAIIKNNDNIKRYQLRKKLKIDVPRFNTNYMRNSVARRGAIVWNTLVPQLNDDIDNVKKYAIMARRSKTLLHLDFDCISPQTLTRWEEDFRYN